MPKLNQIPGNPEVWLVGNTAYIVYIYDLDFIDGEIPVAFTLTAAELEDAFGGKTVTYNRRMSAADFDRVGALDFGSYNTPDAQFDNDPLTEWMENVETEAKVRPWLNDPEVLSVWLGAYLEGRDPTDAEFENTEWWQTHNSAQRQWLLLSMSDPATAAQLLGDSKIDIRAQMIAAGINSPDRELVAYIAEQYTQGNWSATKLTQQINKLSDRWAPGRLDKGLREFLDGAKVDKTHAEEDRVRELSDMWLGPRYGKLTQAQIREWAGKIRNDPDAEALWIEQLKRKRLSLFPQYTDPTTTYDDIAQLRRPDWQDALGEVPDEVNDLRWRNVMRINDDEEVARRITRIGIDRGNERIKKQAVTDVINAFGSTRAPA